MKKYSNILISSGLLLTLAACDASHNVDSAHSNSIDGVYFNAETEQVLLIDRQASQRPIIVYNADSKTSNRQISYANTLEQSSANLISSKDTIAWGDAAGSMLASYSGGDTVILDVNGSDLLNGLTFTRQPIHSLDNIQLNKDDGTGVIWAINPDNSYKIDLSDFSDGCYLTGKYAKAKDYYWQDENAQLSDACEKVEGFSPGLHTVRVHTTTINDEVFLNASVINKQDPSNNMPIWGGIALSNK